MACSSIWIQDINRMPRYLPPWKQIIHNLIRLPNSIDQILTVTERNSVHPRFSYVVTIIFRNSLGIVLPSKWGTISESNIKYEITNTFVAKNAFVGINSVMLEIDRVGILKCSKGFIREKKIYNNIYFFLFSDRLFLISQAACHSNALRINLTKFMKCILWSTLVDSCPKRFQTKSCIWW